MTWKPTFDSSYPSIQPITISENQSQILAEITIPLIRCQSKWMCGMRVVKFFVRPCRESCYKQKVGQGTRVKRRGIVPRKSLIRVSSFFPFLLPHHLENRMIQDFVKRKRNVWYRTLGKLVVAYDCKVISPSPHFPKGEEKCACHQWALTVNLMPTGTYIKYEIHISPLSFHYIHDTISLWRQSCNIYTL